MILSGLPWKWTEIILSFLRLHPSTPFWTLLLTMMAPPFLQRDSCPQYWIQWSSELNSPIPFDLSSLIPRMLTSILAISCLTTSNLPWLMDLTFQVPMPFALYSIGPCFYHQSHPQLGVLLALVSSFHSFWSISPLIFSSISGTYWPGSSSFHVLSFCLFILFIGFSRQEYWSGLPFSSPVDHILSNISPMT